MVSKIVLCMIRVILIMLAGLIVLATFRVSVMLFSPRGLDRDTASSAPPVISQVRSVRTNIVVWEASSPCSTVTIHHLPPGEEFLASSENRFGDTTITTSVDRGRPPKQFIVRRPGHSGPTVLFCVQER